MVQYDAIFSACTSEAHAGMLPGVHKMEDGDAKSVSWTNDVNPDLTDYVTGEALKGVYTMIAVEEKEIRNKVSSRTTDLLKKVFALQD